MPREDGLEGHCQQPLLAFDVDANSIVLTPLGAQAATVLWSHAKLQSLQTLVATPGSHALNISIAAQIVARRMTQELTQSTVTVVEAIASAMEQLADDVAAWRADACSDLDVLRRMSTHLDVVTQRAPQSVALEAAPRQTLTRLCARWRGLVRPLEGALDDSLEAMVASLRAALNFVSNVLAETVGAVVEPGCMREWLGCLRKHIDLTSYLATEHAFGDQHTPLAVAASKQTKASQRLAFRSSLDRGAAEQHLGKAAKPSLSAFVPDADGTSLPQILQDFTALLGTRVVVDVLAPPARGGVPLEGGAAGGEPASLASACVLQLLRIVTPFTDETVAAAEVPPGASARGGDAGGVAGILPQVPAPPRPPAAGGSGSGRRGGTGDGKRVSIVGAQLRRMGPEAAAPSSRDGAYGFRRRSSMGCAAAADCAPVALRGPGLRRYSSDAAGIASGGAPPPERALKTSPGSITRDSALPKATPRASFTAEDARASIRDAFAVDAIESGEATQVAPSSNAAADSDRAALEPLSSAVPAKFGPRVSAGSQHAAAASCPSESGVDGGSSTTVLRVVLPQHAVEGVDLSPRDGQSEAPCTPKPENSCANDAAAATDTPAVDASGADSAGPVPQCGGNASSASEPSASESSTQAAIDSGGSSPTPNGRPRAPLYPERSLPPLPRAQRPPRPEPTERWPVGGRRGPPRAPPKDAAAPRQGGRPAARQQRLAPPQGGGQIAAVPETPAEGCDGARGVCESREDSDHAAVAHDGADASVRSGAAKRFRAKFVEPAAAPADGAFPRRAPPLLSAAAGGGGAADGRRSAKAGFRSRASGVLTGQLMTQNPTLNSFVIGRPVTLRTFTDPKDCRPSLEHPALVILEAPVEHWRPVYSQESSASWPYLTASIEQTYLAAIHIIYNSFVLAIGRECDQRGVDVALRWLVLPATAADSVTSHCWLPDSTVMAVMATMQLGGMDAGAKSVVDFISKNEAEADGGASLYALPEASPVQQGVLAAMSTLAAQRSLQLLPPPDDDAGSADTYGHQGSADTYERRGAVSCLPAAPEPPLDSAESLGLQSKRRGSTLASPAAEESPESVLPRLPARKSGQHRALVEPVAEGWEGGDARGGRLPGLVDFALQAALGCVGGAGRGGGATWDAGLAAALAGPRGAGGVPVAEGRSGGVVAEGIEVSGLGERGAGGLEPWWRASDSGELCCSRKGGECSVADALGSTSVSSPHVCCCCGCSEAYATCQRAHGGRGPGSQAFGRGAARGSHSWGRPVGESADRWGEALWRPGGPDPLAPGDAVVVGGSLASGGAEAPATPVSQREARRARPESAVGPMQPDLFRGRRRTSAYSALASALASAKLAKSKQAVTYWAVPVMELTHERPWLQPFDSAAAAAPGGGLAPARASSRASATDVGAADATAARPTAGSGSSASDAARLAAAPESNLEVVQQVQMAWEERLLVLRTLFVSGALHVIRPSERPGRDAVARSRVLDQAAGALRWLTLVLAGSADLPTRPSQLGYDCQQEVRMALEHMATTLLETCATWGGRVRSVVRAHVRVHDLLVLVAGFAELMPEVDTLIANLRGNAAAMHPPWEESPEPMIRVLHAQGRDSSAAPLAAAALHPGIAQAASADAGGSGALSSADQIKRQVTEKRLSKAMDMLRPRRASSRTGESMSVPKLDAWRFKPEELTMIRRLERARVNLLKLMNVLEVTLVPTHILSRERAQLPLHLQVDRKAGVSTLMQSWHQDVLQPLQAALPAGWEERGDPHIAGLVACVLATCLFTLHKAVRNERRPSLALLRQVERDVRFLRATHWPRVDVERMRRCTSDNDGDPASASARVDVLAATLASLQALVGQLKKRTAWSLLQIVVPSDKLCKLDSVQGSAASM